MANYTNNKNGGRPKGSPNKNKTLSPSERVKNLKELLGDRIDSRDEIVLQILENNLEISDQAAKLIKKDGILTEGRNGEPVRNPMIDVQKNADAIIIRILEGYGATLRSRKVLNENAKQDEDDSPLAAFFKTQN